MIPTAPTTPQTRAPRAGGKAGLKRMNSGTSQRTAQTASTRLPDPGTALEEADLGDWPFEEEDLSQSDAEANAVDDMLESSNFRSCQKFEVEKLVERTKFGDVLDHEDSYLRILREEMELNGFEYNDDLDSKVPGAPDDPDIMDLMVDAFVGDCLLTRHYGEECFNEIKEIDFDFPKPQPRIEQEPPMRRLPGYSRIDSGADRGGSLPTILKRISSAALRQQQPQPQTLPAMPPHQTAPRVRLQEPDEQKDSHRTAMNFSTGAGCTIEEDLSPNEEFDADVEDESEMPRPVSSASDGALAYRGERRPAGQRSSSAHAGPIAQALRRARSLGTRQ